MTKIQEHLLKLLLEIDGICKKYDIEYFIDYGSALGAIRHKGFIPWDDDADVTMTEDNYYKWVEACKKELDPEKRMYRDGRLDDNFPTVFGRYIDLEANARVGKKGEFWEPVCGQCIDVFVMLPLPGDPVKKQEAIDLFYAYDEYSNPSFRHFRMKTESVMALYRSFLEEEKTIGKKAVLRKLEEKIFHKHYDDCDTYVCNSARKWGPTSIAPKFLYDSVYYADFEGHKLPIPGPYVELLNMYYEDTYCMLPDHKKRHAPASYNGISCKIYAKDYMRLLDKEELLKNRQICKNLAVEEGYRMTIISQDLYSKFGQLELFKIEENIKALNITNIRDLLDYNDKEKLKKLDSIFGNYYKVQTSSSVRSWEVYLDIGDELLYAALFNLLYYRNDFYTLAKIIHIRELNNKKLTPEIEAIWDTVLTIRKIKAQIIYKNYNQARKYLDYGMEHYPQCKEIQLCRLDFSIKTDQSEENLASCKKELAQLLYKNPKEDQCIKLMGDIAYLQKDYEKAKVHYEWINTLSLNGMMHQDINEKYQQMPEEIQKLEISTEQIDALPENILKENGLKLEKENINTLKSIMQVDGEDAPAEENGSSNKRTKAQDRLLELMDDLDKICRENNLKYILHGRIAARAEKNKKFTNASFTFEVDMPFSDAMKFCDIVRRDYSENRAIEDWTDNSDLRQLMIRFVDKKSILFDGSSGDYYTKPGLSVSIFIMRRSKSKALIYGPERYIQLHNNSRMELKYTPKQLYAMEKDVDSIGMEKTKAKYNVPDLENRMRASHGIIWGERFSFLGKDKMAKLVMSAYKKVENDKKMEGKTYWYINRGGRMIRFPADLFDNPQRLEFEGHSYNIAGNFESYMKKLFGDKWKTSAMAPYADSNRMRCYIDVDHSYEAYLKFMKDHGYDFESWRPFNANLRDFKIWYKEELQPMEVITNRDFQQIRRSIDRIDAWCKLKNKREAIRAAYDKKDLVELRRLMGNYFNRTDYYKKFGVGFYIDDELFECAKLIWESEGKPNYAAQIYKLVPELYKHERVDDLGI